MGASSQNDMPRVLTSLRMPTPLVKVCGLTRLEDAALAAALGAWAVGFVFAPSRRRLTPEQAAPLAAGARAAALAARCVQTPLAVGVFVDESPEEIVAAVKIAGLDGVQLHGLEPRAVGIRAALGRMADDLLIIQALAVRSEGESATHLRQTVTASRAGADLLLFDAASDGRFGGTGASFPWELACAAAGDNPFLVAGGITPRNARQALAESGAVGVDVSSGLESSPGVKDPDLLRALFSALEPSGGKRP